MSNLAVDDVRVWVPAREFTVSRAFYQALGWNLTWEDGDGLALLDLAGHRFLLQDYYQRHWAENFMMTIAVADAAAWHDHAAEVLADADYGQARVAEARREPWGATVTSVWDPCGVLLHFTQFDT